MDLPEICWGVVGWIVLPQNKEKWRAFLNGYRNFSFHKTMENSE
jgi:hypothetical protein